MTTNTFSKEWPERWARSDKAWSKWKKDAEKGKFPKPKDLQKTCGYCEEHGGVFREKDPDCDKCTLYKKYICHNTLLVQMSDIPIFWLLVRELKRNEIDKPRVIRLINRIADAIKEDDPSKTTVSA